MLLEIKGSFGKENFVLIFNGQKHSITEECFNFIEEYYNDYYQERSSKRVNIASKIYTEVKMFSFLGKLLFHSISDIDDNTLCTVYLDNLQDLFQSLVLDNQEWQNYESDLTGNDMWINDPERKERIEEHATNGSNGSTHLEVIQDWMDFINDCLENCPDYIKEQLIEYCEEVELWHSDNGTIDDIIG